MSCSVVHCAVSSASMIRRAVAFSSIWLLVVSETLYSETSPASHAMQLQGQKRSTTLAQHSVLDAFPEMRAGGSAHGRTRSVLRSTSHLDHANNIFLAQHLWCGNDIRQDDSFSKDADCAGSARNHNALSISNGCGDKELRGERDTCSDDRRRDASDRIHPLILRGGRDAPERIDVEVCGNGMDGERSVVSGDRGKGENEGIDGESGTEVYTSIMGKKHHWKEVYDRELKNFAEFEDRGEEWFEVRAFAQDLIPFHKSHDSSHASISPQSFDSRSDNLP